MWRLLIPLRYFSLRNGEKTLIDIVGTALIATAILIPYLLVPDASFFRTGGLLDKLAALTATLTGFYVAALVAAATFTHSDLDKEMVSGAVFMPTKQQDGSVRLIRLTRRELACAIFGYLSFASLIFAIAAAVAVPVATANPSAPSWYPESLSSWLVDIRPTARLAGMVTAAAVIGHIMTATGLGIYYLVERLQYKTPVVISRLDDAA